MDRNEPEMDQNGLKGIGNGPELTGNESAMDQMRSGYPESFV